MEIIIGIGIFITTVFLIEGGYFAFKTLQNSELKKTRRRLRTLSSGKYGDEEIDILRKRALSQIPWLNRIFLQMPRLSSLDRLLEQANARHPLGFYILLSMLLASLGFFGGSLVTANYLILIPASLFSGMMPFFLIRAKKKRRMQKFGRQLPDALDLIARSLKAGHAFSGGLKMVSDEFDDPIGPEFDKTLDEINFGVGVSEALKNLAKRVDCPDIEFFVISVIIQRETGGNLAEILQNISHIIRERFKLQGRIRTLSTEGKFSAIVLIAIPFFVVFALSIMNPKYISVLITDPIGKIALVSVIFMMIAGIFVMKKMINIKV